jgi:hypothetical protein
MKAQQFLSKLVDNPSEVFGKMTPVEAWLAARSIAAVCEDYAKNNKPEIDGPVRVGDLVVLTRPSTRYEFEGDAIREAKERLKYLEGVSKSIVDPVADTVTGLIIEPARKITSESLVMMHIDTVRKQNPKLAELL